MSRILLVFFFVLLSQVDMLGQKDGYTSEYWEKHWREWPRPVFDYRIDSFVAVEHIVQREYFNTGSNTGGERYQQYARFQYPNQESIDNWAKILFQLPNYQTLEDVDFRIWEKDILVYEARSASLRESFLDSVVSDPHTGKLFLFSLSFPELKPGQIVEVMISATGAPLPYQLGFHQSFPIQESVQRIKIVSAFPLQYSASPGIEHSEDRHFENKFYRFSLKNCEALSPEQGLSSQAAELPTVWIDWLDQVFYYDREESRNWDQIIEHLFYEGELQDYAVYRNSLDREFGLQQYYGSWIRPVRYFHQRPSFLDNNEAQAEGRWRLSKAYAERWLVVQEQLERIVEDNEVPSLEEGIRIVYRAQKKAANRYLRQMPVYPPVFTEYGLLCSHYERLFAYHRVDYRLALYYPARNGEPSLEYPSPWPAYARGIAWRSSPNSEWRFIFPGPYLGQFLKPGDIPPDFEGGTAVLFDRDSIKPQRVLIPKVKVLNHAMEFQRQIVFRKDVQRVVVRDSLKLKGAMQSILASAYLRTDSAEDMLGFTNYQLLHNALLNDSLKIERSKNVAWQDTLHLKFDLAKAKILRAVPSLDRDFALPMVYAASWRWRIESEDSLKVSLPDLSADNPVYQIRQSWQKTGKGVYTLKLDLQLKQCLIRKEDLPFYLDLLETLNSGPTVSIWQLSEV